MAEDTNQKLKQMLEEIQSIKSIISQKKPTLQRVLHPKHARLSMFLIGIGISVFSWIYYYLVQQYVSFSAVPQKIRSAYISLLSLTVIALIGLFFVFWSRSMAKDGNKKSDGVLSAIFSFRIFHLIFPVRILGLVFVLYLFERGMLYFIVPTLSIVVGLQFNFLGCMTETRNYVIGGYWFLVTAVIILVEPMSTPLAIFFSLGCGSLVFGLLPNPEK
ncbi:MAG: hypothetical protein HN580_14860 [Deltaproteobacteria bacterium]|nr:hypothetical protein [Deltaproteobacteria bacterium]MBT4638769.1 hypothetical protein [Deltaproteobacteria bacterium]MBT6500582.1 hypothetical protein [Deltaproteobacteria bacterium]MBT6613327.1 hypothetical protein [Deltaproteobacteria bacterium]MBT7152316.1 hypothetical protein [Deltaproteobacteria bacterium]